MTSNSILRKILSPMFDLVDRKIKFSKVLSKGKVAIQVGFDMDSTTTSDLFHMAKIVGKTGTIIGIDADPKNIELAEKVIPKYQSKIILINKATYSEKSTLKMDIARKASWNRLEVIAGNRSEDYFTNEKIEIEADTLDNILRELDISFDRISHINLTINGAEYDTLKGMTNVLKESKDLSIFTVAGRSGEIGMINGIPDYQAIMNLFEDFNITSEFNRNHPFFWYSNVKNPLKRFSSKKDWPGIVVAVKGKSDLI